MSVEMYQMIRTVDGVYTVTAMRNDGSIGVSTKDQLKVYRKTGRLNFRWIPKIGVLYAYRSYNRIETIDPSVE